MKTNAIALCLLMAAPPALCSVVVHDGAPGIVAYDDDRACLDSNGHVWNLHDAGGWERWESYDPPVPVAQIAYWSYQGFVTIYNEFWVKTGGGWINHGAWPDLPTSVEQETDSRPTLPVAPNPTAGPCRVSFSLEEACPVSVSIYSPSGRLIRTLLSGEHPAGDYSLIWDGKDGAGREAPAGMYFTRIETSDGTTTGRVVLAR